MRKIQKTALVGGTVATLMVGGVAWAAWTSEGSGTGTVTASHQQALEVATGSTSGLYPTGSRTVSVTVKNVNPYAVELKNLEVTGWSVVSNGDDDGPACAHDDVNAEVVAAGIGTVIDPGATATLNDAVEVTMDANAAENCQFDGFDVTVKATADSNVTAP